ncbi:ead/Ea22-like family protein [Escherichia coli]|nr:ead/Ea22-like family protein [Escherichia coli]
MSEINYQALREAAEAIKIAATPQKLLAFRMKVTPQVVLALLDERERNQQYIKRRDQENEEIALTVGKLRVDLEAAKKRIAELEAEPASQTYKLNELSGNYPVTPDGWISCSERMPNDAQWCVVDAADGYYVQCWSEGQGWLGDDISLRNCDVIRWMAIPEPPEHDGE